MAASGARFIDILRDKWNAFVFWSHIMTDNCVKTKSFCYTCYNQYARKGGGPT